MEDIKIHPDSDQEQAPAIDIDKALNKKGFVEFLANYDPNFEPSEDNAEEVSRLYKAFENMSKASKELKQVFKETISKETGLKLSTEDLKCVDEFIAQQAIENPEYVAELLEQTKQFNELPQQIAAKEAEIKAEMKANEAMLAKRKEMKGIKLSNIPLFGGFFRDKSDKEATEARKHSVGKWQDKIDADMDLLEDVADQKTALAEMQAKVRQQMFEDLEPARQLADKARDMVKEKLKNLHTSTNLKDIEQAQKLLEQVKGEAGAISIDYLAEAEIDEAQKAIDEALEQKVEADILEAASKFNLGSTPLARLQKQLESYLNKTQIGSRKQAEAQDLIREKLAKAISAADPAKKILLKRIFIKLK